MRAEAVTPPQPGTKAADNDRELALLRLVAQGDRQAFETLYADYYRRLGRFLARLTQRQELIEEAVNDTFWVVWQKGGEFRGDSLVSTWIMGIAYRCTLKTLRRAGGAATEPLVEEYEDTGTPEVQAQQELRDWVGKGLRHLPLEQRTTLELAYYMGHSCEEIGEIMDCSVGTVKARMFHARVKLRNLLPALGGMTERGKA
ncbi:MAG: polymerase subunit sigma-70 [Nevskia sp.]|jgi:RNA polymerase sigma-70 factor, ECF subfamily|nr:polymerase subunit sigma-70 [Nevskia sp.]